MLYAIRASGTAMVAVAVLVLAGCANAPRSAGDVPAQREPVLPPSAPPGAAPLADGALLTVQDVVQRAQARNLTRTLFAANRAAVAAQIVQARAWANPELELSGGRARPVDGGGSTIYGVDLRQRFELPGKRGSRIDAAQAGAELVAQDIAVDALELETTVRAACLRLATAQRMLLQRQQALQLSEQMQQVVEQRRAAHEADPAELARAALDLLGARMAAEQAQRQVAAAQAVLRVWAGHELPMVFSISDALPETPPLLDLGSALAIAAQHPVLAQVQAELRSRLAELAREERAWQPDLTLGVFAGREADARSSGMSLGIELPLWNRNQGGIALAHAQVQQAQAQYQVQQQIIQRQVTIAWHQYDSQRQAAGPLLVQAKAAAATAMAAKMAAFSAGEIAMLEVLEAQRASQAIELIALEAQQNSGEAWLALGQAMGACTITTPSVGAHP